MKKVSPTESTDGSGSQEVVVSWLENTLAEMQGDKKQAANDTSSEWSQQNERTETTASGSAASSSKSSTPDGDQAKRGTKRAREDQAAVDVSISNSPLRELNNFCVQHGSAVEYSFSSRTVKQTQTVLWTVSVAVPGFEFECKSTNKDKKQAQYRAAEEFLQILEDSGLKV